MKIVTLQLIDFAMVISLVTRVTVLFESFFRLKINREYTRIMSCINNASLENLDDPKPFCHSSTGNMQLYIFQMVILWITLFETVTRNRHSLDILDLKYKYYMEKTGTILILILIIMVK
jgi:hypothetical protein